MTRIATLVIVALQTLATVVQPPTLTSLMTPTITPAVATPTPPPSRRLRHHDLRTRDPPRDRRARAPPLHTRHGGAAPTTTHPSPTPPSARTDAAPPCTPTKENTRTAPVDPATGVNLQPVKGGQVSAVVDKSAISASPRTRVVVVRAKARRAGSSCCPTAHSGSLGVTHPPVAGGSLGILPCMWVSGTSEEH